MNKFHIRFNHQHEGSPLVWRVFENGNEHLASDVKILVDSFTETTIENDVQKWNIACFGNLVWNDTVANIVNKDE